MMQTGKVGIGTTSPSQKLDVQGNIAIANNVIGGGHSYGNLGNSNDATLQLYNSSSGNSILNNISYDIDLQTASTSRLYIDNGGNVGIGTTTPGHKLDVSGGSIRTNYQLISTVATGTAPLAVSSSTLVTNLNADLLDGLHASAFQPIDSDLTEISDLPDGPGLLRKNEAVCGSYTVTGQDGLTYGTVLGADGKCWLDRNLGATQVATSSTDASSYGDLYQWGRAKDGHQIITSGTTSTLSTTDDPGHDDFILDGNTSPYDWRSPQNNNLWQGVSGTNNVCPVGFRLPTQAEWSTLVSAENITNSASAFASSLKLPVAGLRYRSSGGVLGRGSHGYYWSSSVTGVFAYTVDFNSGAVNSPNGSSRAYGFSVRCVKD